MAQISNPFSELHPFKENVERSLFDIKHKVKDTYQIGIAYPFACFEVVPSDIMRIKIEAALKFMPFAWTQMTPLRAHYSFYYVRNRNLMDGWKDFEYAQDESIVLPYIKTTQSRYFQESEIFNKFGIPTTYVDLGDALYTITAKPNLTINALPNGRKREEISKLQGRVFGEYVNVAYTAIIAGKPMYEAKDSASALFKGTTFDTMTKRKIMEFLTALLGGTYINLPNATIEGLNATTKAYIVIGYNDEVTHTINENFNDKFNDIDLGEQPISIPATKSGFTLSASFKEWAVKMLNKIATMSSNTNFSVSLLSNQVTNPFEQLGEPISPKPIVTFGNKLEVSTLTNKIKSLGNLPDGDQRNPYLAIGGKLPVQPINALPFRGYEAIINCYYRNHKVDPLRINGVAKYNVWNTNTKDGADDKTPLDLWKVPWQLDAYTSMLPTTQQGKPSLIEVKKAGTQHELTYRTEDGNTGKVYASIDEKTHQIQSINGTDGEIDQAIIQEATRQAITGDYIVFKDIRYAQAEQMWKERNVLGRYDYRTLIGAHWGVEPDFDVLDMPEYIGGGSFNIGMDTVTNQTGGIDGVPLGDFTGVASSYGESKEIQHEFKESGYVIGIISIVPEKDYSQVLNKMWTRRSTFDFAKKEFMHLGFEPIYNNELCPLQAHLHDLKYPSEPKQFHGVAGYQEMYHEYKGFPNRIQGDFASSLKFMNMFEVYKDVPQLNHEFISINHANLDDVFATTGYNDTHILSQIQIEGCMYRPIAVRSIPSLKVD